MDNRKLFDAFKSRGSVPAPDRSNADCFGKFHFNEATHYNNTANLHAIRIVVKFDWMKIVSAHKILSKFYYRFLISFFIYLFITLFSKGI